MNLQILCAWIVFCGTLLHCSTASLECVTEEQEFNDCYEAYQNMTDDTDNLWKNICSVSGRQVIQCLQTTTRQCPHLLNGDVSEFLTYLSSFNGGYTMECELRFNPICTQAVDCFFEVFPSYNATAIEGLPMFYSWLCDWESAGSISYLHNCFEPREQPCPVSLEFLRNITLFIITDGITSLEITLGDIEDIAVTQCHQIIRQSLEPCFTYEECFQIILGCLSQLDSECFTTIAIDFNRNIFQCEYQSNTDVCIENACGSNVRDFVLEMFKFFNCSYFLVSSTTSVITTPTTSVPTVGVTTDSESSAETSVKPSTTFAVTPPVTTSISVSTTSSSTSPVSSSAPLSLMTSSTIIRATVTPSFASSTSTTQPPSSSSTEVPMKPCVGEDVLMSIGNINITLRYDESQSNTAVTKRCPEEYKGIVMRDCFTSGTWSEVRENCTLDIDSLQDVVQELLKTDPVDNELFKEVMENLTEITNPDRDQRNKPPIDDVRNMITDLANIFEMKSTFPKIQLNSIIYLISNALDDTTANDWDNLKEKGQEGANTIVQDIDKILRKATSQLCAQINETQPLNIHSDNLALEFGRSKNSVRFQNIADYNKQRSEIFVPATALESKGLTNDICYGGVQYKTVSPLLSQRLLIDGEIRQFESQSFFITNVIGLLLEQDLKDVIPPVLLTFTFNTTSLFSPRCVSWNFSIEDTHGGGAWTTQGCSLKHMTETYVICECSHLTNFAILMSTSTSSDEHAMILGIISTVGCTIGILGLLLTIITHLLVWRLVRSDRSTILLHLCVALVIALLVFLVGINRVESPVVCTIIAAILQYLFLVVFFTMLVEGLEILFRLIHVFARKFRLKILLSMAWLIPALIVAAALAITTTEGYGNEKYCWLSVETGLIWSFIGPVAFIIFVNICVIVFVIVKLFSTRAMKDKSTKEKAKTSLRGICVLLPILGVTWLFGLLSVNDETVVFQYIFAVFNSLQGLFIFFFHCVFNKQLRDALKKRAERKRSLATLESELRKRARTESTDEAAVSANTSTNQLSKSSRSPAVKPKTPHSGPNQSKAVEVYRKDGKIAHLRPSQMKGGKINRKDGRTEQQNNVWKQRKQTPSQSIRLEEINHFHQSLKNEAFNY